MFLKNLLFVGLMFCIIFCGCEKIKNMTKGKDKSDDIDNIGTEPFVSEEESEDVFEEFYDEASEETSKSSSEDLSTPSSPTQFNPDGRFVVQVSCVLSRRFAESVVAKLESKGYPAYVAEVENPTPELMGTYHRIRIGGFNRISNAKEFGENYIVNDGYEYWVDNRSNDNIGFSGSGLGESGGDDFIISDKSAPTIPDAVSPPEEKIIPQPVKTESVTPTPKSTQPAAASPPVSPASEVTTPETQVPPAQTGTPGSVDKKPSPTDEWSDLDDEWGVDTSDW